MGVVAVIGPGDGINSPLAMMSSDGLPVAAAGLPDHPPGIGGRVDPVEDSERLWPFELSLREGLRVVILELTADA